MYPTHPLAEQFPLMEGTEFEAFKEDIRANGQHEEIVLFGGKILDGRNRYRACQELKVEPKFKAFTGSEAEAAAFVESQNVHRRHLTAEFVARRIRDRRADGQSYRAIAAAEKVSQKTVAKVLAGGAFPESTSPTNPLNPPGVAPATAAAPKGSPAPVKVTGLDGKKYGATRPTRQNKPLAVPKQTTTTPALAVTDPDGLLTSENGFHAGIVIDATVVGEIFALHGKNSGRAESYIISIESVPFAPDRSRVFVRAVLGATQTVTRRPIPRSEIMDTLANFGMTIEHFRLMRWISHDMPAADENPWLKHPWEPDDPVTDSAN